MQRIRRIAIPGALMALLPIVGLAGQSSAEPAESKCFGKRVNVFGTEGDDTIDLTDGTHGEGPYVVATFGGNDVVIGSPGGDIVCLGDGDDVFYGRGGRDRASGGRGDDTLYGGRGKDRLRGNRGNDSIYGGPGDDLLVGGLGHDHIDGGEGDDRIRGNDGNDRLIGGPGNDDIRGGRGDDHIDGGPGDDLIRGGPGDDRLNGGDASSADSGVDDIRGNRGFDRLWSNWSHADGDDDSVLRGGKDYDYCANGAEQHGCERSHYQAASFSAAREEWRTLVTRAFGRWGLDEAECGLINGEERCVGPQIEQALDVLVCESWGFPFAVSSSGTSGLFQHRPEYFAGRLANARQQGWVDYEWPDDPSTFDPELNIMVAGYLVWRSREVQLGRIAYPGYWNGPPYASNWAKGPDPWGHWTCGRHHGHWYPEWVHPSFDGV